MHTPAFKIRSPRRLLSGVCLTLLLLSSFLLVAPVQRALAEKAASALWARRPALAGAGPHGPTFSGDAPADFDQTDTISVTDPGGVGDVGIPIPPAPAGTVSGWDVAALYFDYDSYDDTMYIGVDCFGICGDADGNGLPGGTSTWLVFQGGVDRPDLADTEFVALLIDTDNDYVAGSGGPGFEVAIGVDGDSDINSFGVYSFTGDPFNPAFGFGPALPQSVALYASPSETAPDLEFSIAGFSTLPESSFVPGEAFSFQIFMGLGSLQDDGIGEDFLPALGDTLTITIPASSHAITVTKSATPSPVPAGGLLTYTLRYTVTGDEPAPDLTIEDPVPAHTLYIDCQGGLACGESGGVVTWELGDVMPPASGSVAMIVQVDISLISGSLLYNDVLIYDSAGLSDTDAITVPVEPPTAAELLYFRVEGEGESDVYLEWATAVEVDNFGFNLYRSPSAELAQTEWLAFVPSAAQGGGAVYHYTDTPPHTGRWWYWLADVNTAGGETWHAPVQLLLGGYHLYLPLVRQ